MKKLALAIFLAFLLAGCAVNQDMSRGKWTDPNAAWECHKLQSLGWAGIQSPCNL
jgi:PBP1b-binding outer membrane lipoprotein LpoB